MFHLQEIHLRIFSERWVCAEKTGERKRERGVKQNNAVKTFPSGKERRNNLDIASSASRNVSHPICSSRFAVIARQWLSPTRFLGGSMLVRPCAAPLRSTKDRRILLLYQEEQGPTPVAQAASQSTNRRLAAAASTPRRRVSSANGRVGAKGGNGAPPPPKWLRNRASIRQSVRNKRAD